MSSSVLPIRVPVRPMHGVLVGLGLAFLGGCSADIGRFNFQGSGLRSDPPPLPSQPLRNSAAINEAPPAGAYSFNPAPADSAPGATAPVRQAGLPEPTVIEPEPRQPITREPALPRAATQSPPPAAGRTVVVVSGDTLYGLSRRHRVSIAELMSANGLSSPTIYPGQKLALPDGSRRAVPSKRSSRTIASAPPSRQWPSTARGEVKAAPPVAVLAPDAAGTHTVAPGESLYSIARKHGMKTATLQSLNAITDPTKLRPGTVLQLHGPAAGPSTTAMTETQPALSPPAATTLTPAPFGTSGGPKIINSNESRKQVAAVQPPGRILNDVAPSQAKPAAVSPPKSLSRPAEESSAIERFRWPAKGRIVNGFGPRSDKSHNDGINILVPSGTDVHAAESGTVAYAGSELKGYGNLVLIRHNGNWVSAYAHNETLLVKRGDKVHRGQTIAKAGKTGAVDQPQVHFELRQGSKPVDPLPHLEK